MNGECDKCGEHTLQCACLKHIPNPTDYFFYQDKFFEKEEEFWDYVKDFNRRQTTVKDFDGLFEMLKKDVWMNLAMRRTQISNAELRSVLEDAFSFILQRIWKKNCNDPTLKENNDTNHSQ